jgi:hypothetical protein
MKMKSFSFKMENKNVAFKMHISKSLGSKVIVKHGAESEHHLCKPTLTEPLLNF